MVPKIEMTVGGEGGNEVAPNSHSSSFLLSFFFLEKMSFFKRKDKSIPPPPPDLTPNQQRAQLFGGSTDYHYTPPPPDDPYSSRHRTTNDSSSIAPSYSSADPYASRSQSNPATRVESDPTRAALFAGYNPEAIPREVGRRVYGERGGEEEGGEQAQEQEDEDVESIKRDIRGVKQESLGSTRSVGSSHFSGNGKEEGEEQRSRGSALLREQSSFRGFNL